MQAAAHSPATGACCGLQRLVERRHGADKLDLKQRRRTLSVLAGSNKTNFRGRGIDFEEVRAYQPGDDIRTIDWRVTARSGSPHTKLFREERERPVLVTVDQRPPMFFGSQHCFKSVLAAEIAALLCWSALASGDRVGGLVFGPGGHREVRPKRSSRSVLALLNHLVQMNADLDAGANRDSPDFTDALTDLRRIARPGSSIFLVSDFSGALSVDAQRLLYQLSRHMEITAIHCADPLEAHLPEAGRYAVTDGAGRATLDTGAKAARQQFENQYQERLDTLKDSYGRLGIPVIEAHTTDSPMTLLQGYYGGGRR